jgi:multiple sugar transport system permease protein
MQNMTKKERIYAAVGFKGVDRIPTTYRGLKPVSESLLKYFGFIDRIIGIVIVYVALNVPFTIWLTDGFFREIPPELSESAQLDGCSRWQAFWRIDFPLAGPGIGASGIFAFLIAWNEFAISNVLTRTLRSKTLPVGLFDFVFEFTLDWRGMCTLAVVMLVPAVIITFIIQKNLVRGLTFGAVKG